MLLAWKGVRSDPPAAALRAPELKGASDARGQSKLLIPGVIQTRQDPGRGFLRVWGAVAETKGLAGEDGAVVTERPESGDVGSPSGASCHSLLPCEGDRCHGAGVRAFGSLCEE